MTVIAMTREMGTLGKDVAQGIADSLDLKVVHSELVEHDLAERLGVQESTVHRYLEGSASMLERWKIDKKKLSRYTADEILELAQQGNVIIRGWGAVAVLRDIPHVLRVRVCAPDSFREGIMMERLGHKEPHLARSEIEQNDAAHARLMRGFFGLDWEDPKHYHVVLNTGAVPVETCVRIVRLLTDDPAFQQTEETRAVLADRLLERHVRIALDGLTPFNVRVSNIQVKASVGKITLTGAVIQNRLSMDAEEAARSIAGVTEVNNRIHVVQTHGSGV